ncbi:uncharacterized protein [Fopius arisanus]|uniref:Uncharacterized protein n=1 Tax=Fopius arisanus TaxID=64838 RepID=A0A9R1SZI9_9HYME|nr:PREDICTED: uncharacterized protein LOC105264641 [Fopius arisanus]
MLHVVKVIFVLLAISSALDIQVSATWKEFWIKLWTPEEDFKWGDNCDRNCRAVCITDLRNSDYSIGSRCNKEGWCICSKSDATAIKWSSKLLPLTCLLFLYKFHW